MDTIRLVFKEGDPDPANLEPLSEGMLEHHAESGHPRTSEKYSIFLKGDDGQVVGGVIATFLWNGMEINSLWVDKSLRRRGWGSKLMGKIEDEGRKRGCTLSYTNTFPWQAPEFYEKLGYSLYGKLEDLPKELYLSYYFKKLV